MSACCIPLQSSRKAFFDSLLARKKSRLQALIAVARKLLHTIFGIFRSGLKYEGQSCFHGSRCSDTISFRSIFWRCWIEWGQVDAFHCIACVQEIMNRDQTIAIKIQGHKISRRFE
jgi:hypothetical protein